VLTGSDRYNRRGGWYRSWYLTQLGEGVSWHRFGLPYSDLVWRCAPEYSEIGRRAYTYEACTSVRGLAGEEWAASGPLTRG